VASGSARQEVTGKNPQDELCKVSASIAGYMFGVLGGKVAALEPKISP